MKSMHRLLGLILFTFFTSLLIAQVPDWENEKGLVNDLHILEGSLEEAKKGDSIVIDDSVAEDLSVGVGDRIICNL